MKYVIASIIVIAFAVGICMVFRRKNKSEIKSQKSADNEKFSEMNFDVQPLAVSGNVGDELIIQMEQLPIDTKIDEMALSEIKDRKVLARINGLIPGLSQVGVAAATVAKAGGETVYRAIIPAGSKLTNSKAMEGAVRGFYHGADGIQGHANLMAVDQTTTTVANTAAAAMGVASMIVGQYYMTQINAELSEINDGIEKIVDFQDNEYKSKVFALVVQVQKIVAFQVEILDNEELRKDEVIHLNGLEDECIRLLEQANLTIAGVAGKMNVDYQGYKKELHSVQNWYGYQQRLLDVLYKIVDLKYTLHFGEVSRNQCMSPLSICVKRVSDAQLKLSEWHDTTVKRLGIEVSETRRKRSGFDRAIHWIPGLFNNDLNFRPISESTAEMIEMQSSGQYELHMPDREELYNKDVQIISKGGKLYYLPLAEFAAET